MIPSFVPITFFLREEQRTQCRELAKKWVAERKERGVAEDKFAKEEVEEELVLCAISSRMLLESKYPKANFTTNQYRNFYETAREIIVGKTLEEEKNDCFQKDSDPDRRFIKLFKEIYEEALEEELKERHEKKLEKS